MAQSQNTKVDFTIHATSMLGLTTYGNIMIGDKAFEFYNEKNVQDFIQIPWTEIDRVEASVLLKENFTFCDIHQRGHAFYILYAR